MWGHTRNGSGDQPTWRACNAIETEGGVLFYVVSWNERIYWCPTIWGLLPIALATRPHRLTFSLCGRAAKKSLARVRSGH